MIAEAVIATFERVMTTRPSRPPRERTRRGTGSGTGDAWRVIVLNDNHNTFEGVAFALAQTLPGIDYDKGMGSRRRIDSTGSGDRLVGRTASWPSSTTPSSRATG